MRADVMKMKETKEGSHKLDKDKERLQKIIANTGYCSRREAEKLIKAGRVYVNGKPVTELGFKASKNDDIRIDHKIIKILTEYKYFVLNKPRGFITTVKDPENRPTVMDLLPREAKKLLPVGRLDFNTEGILLFTNDGELINRLTHPRYQVPRLYLVRARGVIDEGKLMEVQERGINVEGEIIKDFVISEVRTTDAATWFHVEIREGKNREVRRIVEAMGSEVSRLTRIAYGPIFKRIPPKGRCRELLKSEVEDLYRTVNLK